MRTIVVMLPLLLAGLQPALAQDPAPAAPATTEPAAPAAPAAADYTLKATSSTLFVVVYKDPNTLGAGFAHDHAIAATGWSGSDRGWPSRWRPGSVIATCR